MARLTLGLVVFAVTLCIFTLTINGVIATDHSTSFVQLGYSIIYKHSVVLGNASTFHPDSVDDFAYNGSYYSALAPGTVFLALPFLAAGFALAGGYTVFGWVLLASGAFTSLMAALAAYMMYRLSRLYFRPRVAAFLAFALAFSTTVWPFAGWLFQSDVSALLVLLSVYLAVVGGRSPRRPTATWVAAGLALAASVTVDYVNLLLIPFLLAYAFASGGPEVRGRARAGVLVLLSAAVGPALVGLYNYTLFGDPFTTTEQAYLGVGSVFSSFSYPVLDGLSLNLFSPVRGVFVFAPLAILGVAGSVLALKRGERRREFLLMLSVFASVTVAYSAWYGPTGGLSFGPRYLVTGLPFALLPAGLVIEKWGRRAWILALALYLAGVAENGLAAVVTAIPPELDWWASSLAGTIVPQFLNGGASTWWWGSSNGLGQLMAVVVIGLAALAPFALRLADGWREGSAEPPLTDK